MTNHFQKWQATRKFCADLPTTLGIDAESCSEFGYVYDCGYIELRDDDSDGKGSFSLLIERSDWVSNNLTELEEILWQWVIFEWTASPAEISGDDLDVFIRGMCKEHGYECDGGAFGMAFSHVGYGEAISTHDAARIVHNTAKTYGLSFRARQPKPLPAPVGSAFGV